MNSRALNNRQKSQSPLWLAAVWWGSRCSISPAGRESRLPGSICSPKGVGVDMDFLPRAMSLGRLKIQGVAIHARPWGHRVEGHEALAQQDDIAIRLPIETVIMAAGGGPSANWPVQWNAAGRRSTSLETPPRHAKRSKKTRGDSTCFSTAAATEAVPNAAYLSYAARGARGLCA